jgi:hypothetical protein
VDAVRGGRFGVHAVTHADQALELLTGIPAGARGADGEYPGGSVNGRVDQALREMARRRREFARPAGNGAQTDHG